MVGQIFWGLFKIFNCETGWPTLSGSFFPI